MEIRFASLRKKQTIEWYETVNACRAKNQALKILARTPPSWSIFFRFSLQMWIKEHFVARTKKGMYDTMCNVYGSKAQSEFSRYIQYSHHQITLCTKTSTNLYKTNSFRICRFHKSILSDFIQLVFPLIGAYIENNIRRIVCSAILLRWISNWHNFANRMCKLDLVEI